MVSDFDGLCPLLVDGHTQFTQVVSSIFLRNEFNDGGNIAWKHWVTSSIIDIGKDFCRRLYDDGGGAGGAGGPAAGGAIDESSGKEHFYLWLGILKMPKML